MLDTGAYGAVMASNYNRRLLAPEVLVDDGAWTRRSAAARRSTTCLRASESRSMRTSRLHARTAHRLRRPRPERQADAGRAAARSAGRPRAASCGCCRFPTYETPHRRRDRAGAARRARLRRRRDAAALRRQPLRVEAGDRARAGAPATVLVCDRYLASSIAYGEAQGLDAAWLLEMQTLPAAAGPDGPARHPAARCRRAARRRDRDKYERDLRAARRACARATCGRRATHGWATARRRPRPRRSSPTDVLAMPMSAAPALSGGRGRITASPVAGRALGAARAA